jgi:hypothetical protein
MSTSSTDQILGNRLVTPHVSSIPSECTADYKLPGILCCQSWQVFTPTPCSKRRLNHLVSEFVAYYSEHRAHSERAGLPPILDLSVEVDALLCDQVEVKSLSAGSWNRSSGRLHGTRPVALVQDAAVNRVCATASYSQSLESLGTRAAQFSGDSTDANQVRPT